MSVYIYIYNIHMYIYIYIGMYVCIYKYICMYIHFGERERRKKSHDCILPSVHPHLIPVKSTGYSLNDHGGCRSL